MEHLNVIICGFLLMTTLIILALAVFSLHRREVPGAMPFVFLCLVTAFYTAGYGMELYSQTLDQVDFWSKFQYLGLPFIPAIWVVLSIDYAGKGSCYSRLFYYMLFLVPVLTCIFRLTSQMHHLQYGAMRLVSNGYFLVIDFAKGPWYYVHFIYFIACALYAFKNYWQARQEAIGYLNQQASILAVASTLPILSIVLNVLGSSPLGLDSGPFFVIFDYLLFTYGIFNYSLLHLIPLSREKVFDAIRDGVLILDMQGRLMDFNRAAGQIFPQLTKGSKGKLCAGCLSEYPALLTAIEAWPLQTANRNATEHQETEDEGSDLEILRPDNGERRFYQVRMAPLFEKEQLLGFTVLISDMTRQYEMMRQLEQTARTDGLTRLMNRSYFMERMSYEICRCQRMADSVSLILIDIDFFKSVNDDWGHLAGDQVLQELAAIISGHIRGVDLAGRYGGEEFILCLPATGMQQARQIAERLRQDIAAARIIWHGKPIKITASFGVASCDFSSDRSKTDGDTLVGQADESLYQAKRNGRNRVEAWLVQPAADAS